jgi:ATP-dependent RNA helicase DDX10/DBP4
VSITSSIQGLLGKDSELKYLAQRAVVSYLRSVYLQPNKDVFDVDALDVEKFANSVGLPNPPRLRFLKSQKQAGAGKSDDDEDEEDEEEEEEEDDGRDARETAEASSSSDDASGSESSDDDGAD